MTKPASKFILETERLTLRPLKMEDAENIFSYRSNPEVVKYQGLTLDTLEACTEFIKGIQDAHFGIPFEWIQLGVIEMDTNVLIGDCGLRVKSDVHIGEIGITLSLESQGKGYGKEILNALTSYFFEELDLHRIEETVDAENEASIALLESIGYRREGHFIENIFFKGKWGSEYQYALLQKEWEALKK